MPKAKTPSPRLHEARGLRLKIAVSHRYRHAREFGERLQEDGVIAVGAFYSHYNGIRWPSDVKVVREYERRLDLPVDWLSVGGGESIEDLRRALALVRSPKTYPALLKILPFFPPPPTQDPLVNQQTEESEADSSIISQIRHIPILQDREIVGRLSGERVSTNSMVVETMPITPDLQAGPRAFGYRVAQNDLSMTRDNGKGLCPGSRVVIDPDAPISPGCYVLARPKSRPNYMLRRYQAAGSVTRIAS